MPKTIGSSLLADIQANVTSLCTCVEITRRDGLVIRMTTHDTDITFEGYVYRHDLPFQLSAIQSGTQLAVDNTQLTLFCDEINLFLVDFKSGLFQYADVRIFQVDWTNLVDGKIIMRQGWFGPIDFSENHIVQVTVTGLLKVLDMEVGHIFQPACDADLGDSRCKIAIQQSQIRSELNPMSLGDWVYYYDPARMTALTVINPSFETDGTRSDVQAITGWTKTIGAHFQVRGDSGGFGTFSPLAGSFMLVGSAIPNTAYESGLSQDIDVATQIGSTVGIDAGKISVFYSAAILSTFSTKNVWRVRIECLNATGVTIDSQDTRYEPLDTIDSWRERACVMCLLPGTRKVRLWLYSLTGDGTLTGGNAADRVRLYYWDHTVSTPYSDVIHKVARIAPLDANQTFYMYNPSFEFDHAVANANNPTISGWVTGNGNWWQVQSVGVQDGVFYLFGGDDGSGVTKQYTISQVHPLLTATSLNGWGLSQARIQLGKYTGTFKINVGYGDVASKATVIVEWLNDALAVVGSFTALNDLPGSIGWLYSPLAVNFSIPVTATKVKVTLKARSPVGSSLANVGFDNVRFVVTDAERPLATDPATSFGNAATVFNTNIGVFFLDNNIVYKALSALTAYDVVASVTDARKEFAGTNIAGASGAFETGPIRLLSGANAGLKNIVRKWNKTNKHLKLYFRMPHNVAIGDRFYYSQACQHRFVEDCMFRFENTLNFRGFPYVPGAAVTATPTTAVPKPALVYTGLPGFGPAAGGSGILITGFNLDKVAAVSFDLIPAASFHIVDANNLQIITPAHAAGDSQVNLSGSGPGYSFSGPVGVWTFI